MVTMILQPGGRVIWRSASRRPKYAKCIEKAGFNGKLINSWSMLNLCLQRKSAYSLYSHYKYHIFSLRREFRLWCYPGDNQRLVSMGWKCQHKPQISRRMTHSGIQNNPQADWTYRRQRTGHLFHCKRERIGSTAHGNICSFQVLCKTIRVISHVQFDR
jgi:hypothetical protein